MVDVLTAVLCAVLVKPNQPTGAVTPAGLLRVIAGLAVLVAMFGSLSLAWGTSH